MGSKYRHRELKPDDLMSLRFDYFENKINDTDRGWADYEEFCKTVDTRMKRAAERGNHSVLCDYDSYDFEWIDTPELFEVFSRFRALEMSYKSNIRARFEKNILTDGHIEYQYYFIVDFRKEYERGWDL